jgi:hypothetical protein
VVGDLLRQAYIANIVSLDLALVPFAAEDGSLGDLAVVVADLAGDAELAGQVVQGVGDTTEAGLVDLEQVVLL